MAGVWFGSFGGVGLFETIHATRSQRIMAPYVPFGARSGRFLANKLNPLIRFCAKDLGLFAGCAWRGIQRILDPLNPLDPLSLFGTDKESREFFWSKEERAQITAEIVRQGLALLDWRCPEPAMH